MSIIVKTFLEYVFVSSAHEIQTENNWKTNLLTQFKDSEHNIC